MSIREQSVLSRLPTNGVKAIKEFLFKSLAVWTNFILNIVMSHTNESSSVPPTCPSSLFHILLGLSCTLLAPHALRSCPASPGPLHDTGPASSQPTLPAGRRAGFSSQRPAGVPAEPPGCPAPPLPSPRPGALCWSLVQISESLRSNYRQPSLMDTQHIWAWGRDRWIP